VTVEEYSHVRVEEAEEWQTSGKLVGKEGLGVERIQLSSKRDS
jgi:hypothetical protein